MAHTYFIGGLAALALGSYFLGVWWGWQMGVGTFFAVLGGCMLQRAMAADTEDRPGPRRSFREPDGT